MEMGKKKQATPRYFAGIWHPKSKDTHTGHSGSECWVLRYAYADEYEAFTYPNCSFFPLFYAIFSMKICFSFCLF